MPRLRIDYFLAGLLIAVGLAVLLGAAGHSWAAAATFAALSLTDVLLAGVGLLVAAMTGVAGALVVADARADAAAAHAWQDISAELAVVATVTETAPVRSIDERYITSPQDEGLRRFLLAHRYILPVPSLRDVCLAAPPRANAVAAREVDGAQSDTEHLITHYRAVADRKHACTAATSDAAPDCPPAPIAGHVNEIGGRSQRSTKRRVSRALLVANAGVWWSGPFRTAVDVRRALAGGCAADVVVLADRSSGDRQPAHRDLSPVPATTAQPGCRGPPVGVSQQQASTGPGTIGKSFRENVQSRADKSTDPAVIDNLGDRVPVDAAELDVVERYLDDVLGDLLATVAADRDRRGS